MNPYRGDYIVDKIRILSDGSIHEIENRLNGREVTIHRIEINKSLLAYFNDGNGMFTSLVKKAKDYDDYIQVYTMNTLYQFKKVNK